jgi:hypothetical protein
VKRHQTTKTAPGGTRILTVALALAGLVFAAGCQTQQRAYQLTKVVGDLPATMNLPRLSGDSDDVVRQLCAWSNTQQLPFDENAIEDVYVARVSSQEPRVAAWNLLYSFAETSRNPRRIALSLDPSAVARPHVNGGVYDLVQHAGVWTFEKTDPGACRAAAPSHAMTEGGNPQCIRVSVGRDPTSEVATAEYYNVAYRMVDGPLPPRQLIDMEILTIAREGALIGRSMRVRFSVNPLVVGGVNTVCEPPLFPSAFESSAGD